MSDSLSLLFHLSFITMVSTLRFFFFLPWQISTTRSAAVGCWSPHPACLAWLRRHTNRRLLYPEILPLGLCDTAQEGAQKSEMRSAMAGWSVWLRGPCFANYRAAAKRCKQRERGLYRRGKKENTTWSMSGSSEAFCGEERGFGSLSEAPLQPLNRTRYSNSATFNGYSSHNWMHIERQRIKVKYCLLKY